MSEPVGFETTGATTGLRFKLEKLIGRGSFGLVYQAIQLGLNRPVALKLLHPDALEDMEQVGRFLNEARLTASLSHPHIVEVIDHGVAGEQPWIAYELLAGPTLRALVTKDGLPWREALALAIQLAGALDAAHRQGVIHRDVKPENVMQSGPGHFKLTDFGLAKWNHRAAFRTGAHSRMGTPAYIAPELIATNKASPASDQYALAVVLYELLTGQAPFAGQTAAALLERHLKAVAEPPSRLRPGIPPGVDASVLTALAKNPRDRHASVAEFRDQLARLLETESYTPVQVPVVRPVGVLSTGALRPPSMFRQFWIPLTIGAALLVAVLALDPFHLRGRARASPVAATATPAPRPRPASRLSAAEPGEIREQLVAVLERQDGRLARTNSLAAALNPLFMRLADAAPEAAALEGEIRTDERMLAMLRERMLAYYPEPDLVPDAEATLVARVLVNAARGWCWLENMANTREAIDAALAAHGDQTHDPRVIDAMDAKSYSAGGDVFVVESARAIRDALVRLQADPALMTPEVGDLITELYWLGSMVYFRPWPAEAQVRLREVGRLLTTAGDAPLARAVAAVWQLGSLKHAPVKPAREAAHQALLRLAASGLPHAQAIVDRVERDLETGAKPAPHASPRSSDVHPTRGAAAADPGSSR